MTRPVYVTGGASARRWVQITELNGLDISGDTVKVALLPLDQDPTTSDGVTPSATAHPSPDVFRAAITVDNTFAPGVYRLFGKITDSPEVEWLEAGLVEVR